MTAERDIAWDGFVNARDLGGLPLTGGGQTSFGGVVRSEHPMHLSEQGWDAMWDYGIRTIVSLETGNLDAQDALRANPPVHIPGRFTVIRQVHAPIENGSDTEFMQRWADTGLWGTPLYFSDALNRWPNLHARALSAIADAPAGVLLHCGRGHDRTGIVSLLLLTLAGATHQAITEDYLLSADRLAGRDPGAAGRLAARMREEGTTVRAAIAGILADLDIEGYLTTAGMSGPQLDMLRRRLVHTPP